VSLSAFNLASNDLQAYCGFSDQLAPYRCLPKVVVSGNWGCGIFKGDKELKCLIQLMACAQAGKSLAYCTFCNEAFAADALEVFQRLCSSGCTVGQLWGILSRVNPESYAPRLPSVFQIVLAELPDGATGC
uniref:Poly(ADP-ribose) glycohydrolase n=1 Tax=Mesocestoides corti TaxID=53468 RepID=A0A5K3FBG9_MESCO